ncbi:EAP30/Vps36 family-domain-containing protein [Zopfochytrium polystomum]|nr:EAP30/Vps36 family-domain-containing protein [Zopfochytrium polystomum]
MASAAAADLSIAAPAWKRRLAAALAANKAADVGPVYMRPDGRPANRTVVFRGFWDANDSPGGLSSGISSSSSPFSSTSSPLSSVSSLTSGSVAPFSTNTADPDPPHHPANAHLAVSKLAALLTFVTDMRTSKCRLPAEHVSSHLEGVPAEACWYLPATREQWRLSGRMYIVGGEKETSSYPPWAPVGPARFEAERKRLWGSLSPGMRASFAMRGQPGAPIETSGPLAEAERQASALLGATGGGLPSLHTEDARAAAQNELVSLHDEAYGRFGLVLLDVEEVDHLDLKPGAAPSSGPYAVNGRAGKRTVYRMSTPERSYGRASGLVWHEQEAAPLTASFRPALLPGETILATLKEVGLYDGNVRQSQFDSGIVYATTHRIVWVDNANNTGMAIHLERVHSITSLSGFPGLPSTFLRSSPKIVLTLLRDSGPSPSSSSSPTPPSASARTPAAAAAASTQQDTWDCSICDSINPPTAAACEMCGVKRPAVNLAAAAAAAAPAATAPQNNKPRACPVCTFVNHPAMTACEMCDSPLSPPAPPASASTPPPALSAPPGPAATAVVKLSCRAGSHADLLKAIQSGVAGRRWEATQNVVEAASQQPVKNLGVGGISGIMKTVETSNKAMDQTLSQAFKDMDALMAKAGEMVKLAESINSKLAASSGNLQTGDSPELVAFRSYLVELGIPSPVTRETTGDLYSQELAKELAEFLDKVLEKHGGMMALTDLYCLFNRARGSALISPKDLQTSVSLFETMKLPYRVRRFEKSGLLVVQSSAYSDDAIATRVLARLEEAGRQRRGVSAYELAAAEGVPVVLASEQVTERYGLICRDDSWEGLRFYKNLIATAPLAREAHAAAAPQTTAAAAAS